MRDYRKLEAFRHAHELVLLVYRHTRHFPADEKFGLTSQLRRAAVSITSNIVEGSARSSEAEYRRYLEMAHSSSWEVEYQLSLASELGYFLEPVRKQVGDPPPAAHAIEQCQKVSRMLHGLLQAFAKEGPKQS